MPANPQVKLLQARKLQLLAQAEEHRRTLALDLADLELATGWIDRAVRFAEQATPTIEAAMPLVDTLMGRHTGHVGFLGRVGAGMRLWQRCRGLWSELRGSPP